MSASCATTCSPISGRGLSVSSFRVSISFPSDSAFENVEYPLLLDQQETARERREADAWTMLDAVGLTEQAAAAAQRAEWRPEAAHRYCTRTREGAAARTCRRADRQSRQRDRLRRSFELMRRDPDASRTRPSFSPPHDPQLMSHADTSVRDPRRRADRFPRERAAMIYLLKIALRNLLRNRRRSAHDQARPSLSERLALLGLRLLSRLTSLCQLPDQHSSSASAIFRFIRGGYFHLRRRQSRGLRHSTITQKAMLKLIAADPIGRAADQR